MIKQIISILSIISCTTLLANSQTDIEAMIQQKMSESQNVINNQRAGIENLTQEKIREMAARLHIKQESQQGVMIFISLSMPKPSLRQILVEAREYKIPVLIQGLVNNSFQATKSRMDKILRKGKLILNGATELNPMWFMQFDIKRVPAFVSYKRSADCVVGHICKTANYDVVYGNISVEQGLDILANKAHDVKPAIAQSYLQNHKQEQAWKSITKAPYLP